MVKKTVKKGIVMDWISITKFLIILILCIIFVWDAAVMIFAKDPTITLSFSLYSVSRDHPVVPFAIGVLCGHVFWPLVSN